jgi:hypothetical protein
VNNKILWFIKHIITKITEKYIFKQFQLNVSFIDLVKLFYKYIGFNFLFSDNYLLNYFLYGLLFLKYIFIFLFIYLYLFIKIKLFGYICILQLILLCITISIHYCFLYEM